MAQPLTETGARAVDGEHAPRLARLIHEQFTFVWRLLRRIGITEVETDSAVQEVFDAAAQRIDDIRAGSERSFLFSTALHVAARVRRGRAEPAAVISDRAPALEDLDEQAQAREMLAALLEQMPLELRVVFVLHQIEGLPSAEIASVVGIPIDTVAARLSEAQEDFATHLEPESDLAVSLLAAAREEHPPNNARTRALSAAGVANVALPSAPEANALRAPGAGSARPGAAPRSPFALAARWTVYGFALGLVLDSAVYALTQLAPPSPGAAAHSAELPARGGNSGAP